MARLLPHRNNLLRCRRKFHCRLEKGGGGKGPGLGWLRRAQEVALQIAVRGTLNYCSFAQRTRRVIDNPGLIEFVGRAVDAATYRV